MTEICTQHAAQRLEQPTRLQRHSRGFTFIGIVTFVMSLASVPAIAQVTLTNSVQKIVTSINEEGELERKLVEADSVIPGDELRYTISFANGGGHAVDSGSIVITNPIPDNTEYLDGTAFGSGTEIVFSVDGEEFAEARELIVVHDGVETPASASDYESIRWIFRPELAAGATGHVSFNVRLR